MQTRQGGLKILRKLGVGSTGGDIWASNQYVIISCQAMGRQKQARNRAQTSFGAISRHCIANLFGTGVAHSQARRFFAGRTFAGLFAVSVW